MHRCVLIALSAALLISPARAAVLHVDANAVPGGDGSAWNSAYATMEAALAAAGDGDELWVATGTYVPAVASFEVGANVAIYGGFAGTEANRDERDVEANPTILSGDVNGDDGPDFTKRDDNVGSVVLCLGGVSSVTIDGFTIQGGDAELGAGIRGSDLDVVVRACRFTMNRADGGGAMQFEDVSLHVSDCVFETNHARRGGAISADYGTAFTIERCAFQGNRGIAGAGGAMRLFDVGGPVAIRDSTFVGGESEAAGGAAYVYTDGAISVDRCEIVGNVVTQGGGGGLWLFGMTATVSRCVFTDNDGPLLGGGLATGGAATIVSCVFSRNQGGAGGGIYAGAQDTVFDSPVTVINCSLSGNIGGAIATSSGELPFVVRNSIIWGNTPDAFMSFIPPGPLPDEQAVVSDSIVQGGHPGSNNLDVDPLFRQPGLDDLRLTAGSPAIDAGQDAHLPVGFDEFDVAGAPRIQGESVDMGAYEGIVESAAAQAVSNNDIDEGESVLLAPLAEGPVFSPIEVAGLVVMNESGGDGGAMTVTQPVEDPFPDAGGYRFLSDVLEVETTIVAGAFVARLSIPFDADDLNGLDPLELDITEYDPTTNTWALAVSANVNDAAPVGTRFAVASESNPALNLVPGDYGVYWKPSEQRGFAWANVNHTSTFGVGVPRCRADVAQPPNGSIGFADLMAVLAAWGSGAGPTDVDFDGAVGLGDVTALLQDWGACQN